MTRKTPILITAFLVAAIALVGSAITDRVLADEMKVTSSDTNARFMALGIGKSVVIDLATDATQVLVADSSIVKTLVLSKRRVSIIGAALGQTNVYFFDANGRQIGGLNIAVLVSPPLGAGDEFPANVVTVFRGNLPDLDNNNLGLFYTYNCGPWPQQCVDPRKPGAAQPPGTQNVNITGNGAGASTVPVGAH
jgi:hypothetical protein